MTTNNNTARDFLLGLVFFGSILFLVYVTVGLTGFTFAEKSRLEVWFPNAAGLKEGDAVLVSGRQTGKVRTVAFFDERPDNRRIRVEIEFETPVTLHQDHDIRIQEFTLLGGRVVSVDPGSAGQPVVGANAEILGIVEGSPIKALGEFVEENRADVRAIVENLRTASDGLASGEGVLGALLYDEKMREDLDTFIDLARNLAEDISQGKGAIGALVADEEVRQNIVDLLNNGAAATEDIRLIAEDIARGEGTIGAFLHDPEMRQNALETFDNFADLSDGLRTMIENANSGRGLIGRLLIDDALAEDAANFMEDLAEVTARLRRGDGSLGRLLAKEDAYDELMKTLVVLNNQLEDAREAQPVQSFVSLLFGTF